MVVITNTWNDVLFHVFFISIDDDTSFEYDEETVVNNTFNDYKRVNS